MKINIDKLNIAMAEKCFSNQELSKKAKISLATLVMIKANKRNCRAVTVGKIAKALNIPVAELVAE